MSSGRRGLLIALFVASGAVGIQYEVLWLRVFTLVTGSSVKSVTAVVAAFLLGLALGGAIFGRRADRALGALRLYALLEVGVGLLHLAAFGLFRGFDGAYAALGDALSPLALQALAFALAAVFVTVPATLLGGTLPALIRHLADGGADAKDAADESGRLYALNTLGAGLGALLLGQAILPAFGYGPAVLLACAASVVLGLVALALSRGVHEPALVADGPVAESAPAATTRDTGDASVLAAYAASGFACLGYEVVWSRLLEYRFLGTLQSFAWLLLLFLVGLAAGTLVGLGLARRAREPRVLLGVLLVLAGAGALVSVPLIAARGIRDGTLLLSILGITALGGAAFPLAVRLSFRGVAVFGRTVGDLYAVNTAGSIAGTCLAGFLLVPRLGSQATLVLLAALQLAAGCGVLRTARPRLAALLGASGAALVVACVAFVPGDAVQAAGYRHLPGRVLFSTETELETLAVLEDDFGARSLYGGPQLSGTTSRRAVQIVQGHLAMLVHPRPRRVLEIGYGVGEILRAILRHEPEQVDLVEIDPGMVPVADAWFERVNGKSSQAPVVRTTVMDGRHFLATTRSRYDVIVSDTFFILSAGSSRLYTREHFENGARHLEPGGVMVIWLPLNMGCARTSIVLETFRQVFPRVLCWWDAHSLFVIGAQGLLGLSLADLEARAARVQDDLTLVGLDDASALLGGFRVDEAGLADLFPPDARPTHRDLDPALDFAPRSDWSPDDPLLRALRAGGPQVVLPHLGASGPADRARLEAAFALRAAAAPLVEQARAATTPRDQPDWIPRSLPGTSLAAAADAFRLLELALAIDHRHLGARGLLAELGLLLAVEGPAAERRAWLERVARLHPMHRATCSLLADELERAGELERAREHRARVLRAQPYATVKAGP